MTHAEIEKEIEAIRAELRNVWDIGLKSETRIGELELRVSALITVDRMIDSRLDSVRAGQLNTRDSVNAALAAIERRIAAGEEMYSHAFKVMNERLAIIEAGSGVDVDSELNKLARKIGGNDRQLNELHADHIKLARRVEEIVKPRVTQYSAVGGVSDEPIEDSSTNRDLERIREIQSACGSTIASMRAEFIHQIDCDMDLDCRCRDKGRPAASSTSDLRTTPEDRAILGAKPGDKFPGRAQMGEQFYRGDPSIPKSDPLSSPGRPPLHCPCCPRARD